MVIMEAAKQRQSLNEVTSFAADTVDTAKTCEDAKISRTIIRLYTITVFLIFKDQVFQ